MAGSPLRKWFGGRGGVSCLIPVTLPEPSPRSAIASGSEDGVIRVWDVLSDGPPVASFTAHAGQVTDLAQVNVAGQQFAVSVGTDSHVRVWDMESTRSAVWSAETPHAPHAITALTLPDNVELLVAGGGMEDDGWLRVWDMESREVIFNAQAPEIRALASARLSEHKSVLAGCGFGHARYGSSDATMWHVTAEREFIAVTEHGLSGAALDFIELSDGRILIMMPGSLVDPQDGRQLYPGPPSLVWSIATLRLPEGKQIAACGGPYGDIRFLDIELGMEEFANKDLREILRDESNSAPGELGEVREHEFYVYALAAVPDPGGDGELLVSGGQDGTVRVWDPASRTCMHEPVTGHAGAVTALTAVNNGTDRALLVSGDRTGAIWCWEPETGARKSGPLTGHADVGGGVLALVPDPSASDAVLAAGGNAQLAAWHGITGPSPTRSMIAQDQASVYGGVNGVTAVPSPDQDPLIAMTAESGHVRLWRRGRDVWNELFPDSSDPHLPGSREIVALSDGTDTIVAYTRGRQLWLRRLSDWGNPQRFETEGPGAPLSLAAVDIGGATLLACGHARGYIAFYNLFSGEKAGSVDTKSGSVQAMATWHTAEGRTLLASGHATGEITTWEIPEGIPDRWVHAHHGSVMALATISIDGGPVQLASGGSDGLICLWDPSVAGVAAYQAASEVATMGFGDQPSPRDLLGRTAIVDVVTEILSNPARSESSRESLDDGPTVIAIDGAWGSGKTTIMGLVYEKLLESLSPIAPASARPLSPAAAQRLLRNRSTGREPTELLTTDPRKIRDSRILPGWFDPWVHQSGEQLWAGLARTIIEVADKALLHDVNSRHRYWFAHNARRVDPQLVRRRIWLKVASPLLSAAAATALIPIILQLVLRSTNQTTQIAVLFGHPLTGLTLAIALPLILTIAGIIHTLARYFFGNIVNYLDAGIFQGPLPPNEENQCLLRDPMYQADSGYLDLVQHDIGEVLDNLRSAGYRLVVFIDDLDRCAPVTAAAMLEAMNLFLSGALPRARFVIGLDSAVTAGHIDAAYEKLQSNPATLHPGDPSIGWTFLRKLIQLPIPMPAMSEEAVGMLVEGVLGARTLLAPADCSGVRHPWTFPSAERRSKRSPQWAHTSQAQEPMPKPSMAGPSLDPVTSAPPLGPLPPAAMYRQAPGQRWAWSLQVLEDSAEVRSTLQSRMIAQPHLTAREGKRLITVWQYCVRLMDHWQPLPATETLERAQALILVAEIITRWPACMATFRNAPPSNGQASTSARTGVQVLAAGADNNDAWYAALQGTGLDKFTDSAAIRQLLEHPQGRTAAELFTQLILGTDPTTTNSEIHPGQGAKRQTPGAASDSEE
jgi:WD40 repeat protein